MTASVDLVMGHETVTLHRSATQLAVRQGAGMGLSFDMRMRALASGTPVVRRGQIDEFIILEVPPGDLFARATVELRSALSVRGITPVYHTSNDQVPFIPAGTLFLAFTPNASEQSKQSVLERHGLQLVAAEEDGFLTVRVMKAEADAVEIAAQLQWEDIVEVAEPDLITTRRMDTFVRPSDELLARQWHLENRGEHGGQTLGFKAGADARVVRAWERLGSLGSSEPVVGVIDDGFDLSHPDLAGKWVSPWNFATNSADVSAQPDLSDPAKGAWHGTCCAGVAVGTAEGGQIIGAAPRAKLLPVRMNQTLSPVMVAQWFDHMVKHGAWVVSCSWGAEAAVYPLCWRVIRAIARCAQKGRNGQGCVVVFAAGNSSSDINDPPRSQNGFANHPDVIAVTACSSRDEHSDYSNFGKQIAVCAPSSGLGSWGIITSDVRGMYVDSTGTTWSRGYTSGDYYFDFGGTSSACPLVAGICALVLDANPELTAKQVREVVKGTARKIGRESEYEDGHSAKFGYGCIDAEKAVEAAIELAEGPGKTVVANVMAASSSSFESVIRDALGLPHTTAELVATAISSSEPFLSAVRLGLSQAQGYARPEDAAKAMRSILVATLSETTNHADERSPERYAGRVE